MEKLQECTELINKLQSGLINIIQTVLENRTETDLSKLSKDIRHEMHSIGAGLLEQLIAAKINTGYEGAKITRNGNVFEFKEYRTKTYTSSMGKMELQYAYYYSSAAKQGLVPLEENHLWLKSSFLPDVSEMACLVCAHSPYHLSQEILESVGDIFISASHLETLVHTIGGSLGEEAPDALNPDDFPETEDRRSPQLVVISADGTMVNTTENKWREVKTGAVYEIAQKRRLDGSLIAVNKTYVSRIEHCEIFGNRLFNEALRRGAHHAKQIVFISDGAQWLWDMVATHFPKATGIVDWYHATEHLWGIADLVFGTRESETAKAAEKEWETLLFDGKVEELISRLNIHQKNRKEKAMKAIETAIAYFVKNKERMRYKNFRNSGYPIGSGVIEGACKNLVQQRLKRSGMRWTLPGAHAVLSLRCLHLGNQWQKVKNALRWVA